MKKLLLILIITIFGGLFITSCEFDPASPEITTIYVYTNVGDTNSGTNITLVDIFANYNVETNVYYATAWSNLEINTNGTRNYDDDYLKVPYSGLQSNCLIIRSVFLKYQRSYETNIIYTNFSTTITEISDDYFVFQTPWAEHRGLVENYYSNVFVIGYPKE